MFRFKEKFRLLSIRHEGSDQVLEIGAEWHLWKLALAFGATLYAVYESYHFAKFYLHPGRFESIASLMPIAELVTIVLALAIAKDAALEALSKEEVRINPESGRLFIATRLWKFRQKVDIPISEIRDLHLLHSNQLNSRERTGVEFYHGKYGYRFAQGTSREDQAKIVRLLESVGASTLSSNAESISYSPSTPPQ